MKKFEWNNLLDFKIYISSINFAVSFSHVTNSLNKVSFIVDRLSFGSNSFSFDHWMISQGIIFKNGSKLLSQANIVVGSHAEQWTYNLHCLLLQESSRKYFTWIIVRKLSRIVYELFLLPMILNMFTKCKLLNWLIKWNCTM